MPRKQFPFQIGADPEFSLLFQNKRLHAKEVMKRSCKDIQWKNEMGWTKDDMKGEMGVDGCEATGEIRPDPANTVDGCIDNMRSILEASLPYMRAFSLTTLSTYAPVGGHIHLDLPDGWGEEKTRNAVTKLLSFYVPITMNENPISRAIRTKNYGDISDHRTMTHENGVSSVEIRCPSAEWITTPQVMAATLAYFGTIWNEILHHESNIRKLNKIIMKNTGQLHAVQEMTVSEHPLIIETIFKQIKAAVKTFEFYPEYKKEIDLLFNPRKIIQLKTECGYDLWKGWDLKQKTSKLTKKFFLSSKDVQKKMKEKNLDDDLVSQITMPYNDDKNIVVFANALESRMLAGDWEPKFRYYLFGIKEGINQPFAGIKNGMLALGEELVKTEEDKTAISECLSRMIDKAMGSFSRDLKIDPIKGIVFDERPIVAFGIPRTWREESTQNVAGMLHEIWRIEHDDNPFKEMTVPLHKNTEPIESHIAFTLNAETWNPKWMTDESSRGHLHAASAIRELSESNGSMLLEQPSNSSELTT